MHIGMFTRVPNTPEAKAAMLTLAARLADAAKEASIVAELLGGGGVSVENRNLDEFLASLGTQITGVANRS